MNYVILLAGGKGSRMGHSGVPKQFLNINNKPIIIYTLERLLSNKNINKIIISCNKGYIGYLQDLLEEYNYGEKTYVTSGGENRLESVLNGINFIKNNWQINDDDIFLAHDSVRPFVSDRIIDENIEYTKKYGAATTVVDLTETIVETNEKNQIYKTYPRSHLYSGQSPQSFNIKLFLEQTSKIPKEKLQQFTDLSENIVYNGGTVYPVIGDKNNIKITTPIDLIIASNLLAYADNKNILESFTKKKN